MCFAILAGKLATTDGSVILGHNEQNYGRNMVNYRKVERKNYKNEDGIKFSENGVYRFSGETYSYLWVESPGLEFSDNCFNEHGVAVTGNGCPTKEDDLETVTARGDIRFGGIGYMLPQMIAMLSKTAREAVEVAATFITEFGYTGTGRTLSIADKNEAWVMSIVRGRHYIASKVPDDKVVIVPNTHIINHQVNLNDTDNVIYSDGLVEYAISRGWYNPEKHGQFNFAEAYSAKANDITLRNKYGVDSRQWYVQSLVTGESLVYPPNKKLSFSVTPMKKVDVKWTMSLLRSHLENLPEIKTNAGLHRYEADIDQCEVRMACNIATQESSIFQLRRDMPTEIGCLVWRALSAPCLSVYTPWYSGINYIPKRHSFEFPLENHYNPPNNLYRDNNMAFWSFYNLVWYADRLTSNEIKKIKNRFTGLEDNQFAMQQSLEEMYVNVYGSNKELCLKLITNYCLERAAVAELEAKQLLNDLK